MLRWRAARTLLPALFFSATSFALTCGEIYKQLQDRGITEKLPTSLGIEVEGSIPKAPGISPSGTLAFVQTEASKHLANLPGVSDVKVYTQLPNALVTRLVAPLARFVGLHDHREFLVEFTFQGKKQLLKIENDSSIVAPKGQKGIEISSPILTTRTDLANFLSVIRHLKTLKFQATPISSGVHIHLGVDTANPENVKNIVKVFERVEADIPKYFGMSAKRARFAKAMSEALKRRAKDPKASVEDLLVASGNRNHMLNLLSLKEFGTVELRIFNSTVDLETIIDVADFGARLVDASVNRYPEVERVLAGREPSEALPELIKFLGLNFNGHQLDFTQRALKEIEAAGRQRYPAFSRTRPWAYVASVAFALGSSLSMIQGSFFEDSSDDDEQEENEEKKVENPGTERSLTPSKK